MKPRPGSNPGFLLKWTQPARPARVPCGRAVPGPAGLSSAAASMVTARRAASGVGRGRRPQSTGAGPGLRPQDRPGERLAESGPRVRGSGPLPCSVPGGTVLSSRPLPLASVSPNNGFLSVGDPRGNRSPGFPLTARGHEVETKCCRGQSAWGPGEGVMRR